MHRHGIAAVLATGIIAITAEPAQADPPPILPTPIVSIEVDLFPDPKPTPTTTAPMSAPSATKQGGAPTKTATAKKGKSSAPTASVTTTWSTRPSKGTAAQRGAATTTSPSSSPSPRRTLRPAAPPPSYYVADAVRPSSGDQGPTDNFVAVLLAATIASLLALLVVAMRSRPRSMRPVGMDSERVRAIVDGDGPPPVGMDPASVAAARRIARHLDGCS